MTWGLFSYVQPLGETGDPSLHRSKFVYLKSPQAVLLLGRFDMS